MKQLRKSPTRTLWALAVRALAIATLTTGLGCSKTDHPSFRLNEIEIAARELPIEQQQILSDVLYALFGTPDAANVPAASGLDANKIRLASGPVWSDSAGRQRGLYRQQCGHCHGTSGDGMGPTAAILNPYPRDYRRGLFKFKSTERAAEPTDQDLERLLRGGIPGTAMPSFDLLPADEVAALVEYVKYLSIRGQTESALINAMSDMGRGEWKDMAVKAGVWDGIAKKNKLTSEAEEEKLDDATLVQKVLAAENLLAIEKVFLAEVVVGDDKALAGVKKKWHDANGAVIQPPERSEMSAEELEKSVLSGRELFYGKGTCVKCHGPSQLGDGQTGDYDDWNKPIFDLAKAVKESQKTIPSDPDLTAAERARRMIGIAAKARALEYDALEPRTITPRNLRLGIYRGGRRPLDLYRRVHAGINGAPMPGVGVAKGAPPTPASLTPEEIWNLVDYVRSLPYESISKPPQKSQKFSGREQL